MPFDSRGPRGCPFKKETREDAFEMMGGFGGMLPLAHVIRAFGPVFLFSFHSV